MVQQRLASVPSVLIGLPALPLALLLSLLYVPNGDAHRGARVIERVVAGGPVERLAEFPLQEHGEARLEGFAGRRGSSKMKDRRIDDAVVHEPQRLEIVLQRMPDDDRSSVHVIKHAGARLGKGDDVGTRQGRRRDAREARIVVEDRSLFSSVRNVERYSEEGVYHRADKEIQEKGAVVEGIDNRDASQFHAVRRVHHFAVDTDGAIPLAHWIPRSYYECDSISEGDKKGIRSKGRGECRIASAIVTCS